MTSDISTVTLTIINAEKLLSGGAAMFTFSRRGGAVGSGKINDWVLRDRQGLVQTKHCQISFIDNLFCLTDLSGATFMNSSSMAIGVNHQARLNDNDRIQVGPFVIRVSFDSQQIDTTSGHRSLETLFESEQMLSWSVDGSDADIIDIDTPMIDDPLSALAELQASDNSTQDYINIEDATHDKEPSRSEYLSAQDQQWIGQSITYQADNVRNQDAAIELKSVRINQECGAQPRPKATARQIHNPIDLLKDTTSEENIAMNSNELDELEKEIEKGFAAHSESSSMHDTDPALNGQPNHMVTGPMLKGLGVSTQKGDDFTEMHQLSEEIGASLKAAIKGLLSLHQQVRDSRYGQMNKNLQPIEDNPLRLGLSYEKTVETLFENDRSMVHLSAPAAIEESLKTVKDHNQAVQEATTAALNQIVQAFSPEVLLRRFKHYRRSTQSEENSTEAWAWKMYQNYYRELMSSRQHGFEKLFWEVFDQAYDRSLRQKQQEF
ncbi:type VI secretion system-associated FHA domain protein TagH [Celerinatantimonas yamalensis]|uniref:Type VI secretion system-associated FHA domain protein TagH n=1 Tax=Celerinatantimonas yamalensis TaxID=559956 RepID=A0ABW9G4Y0_9GAMM